VKLTGKILANGKKCVPDQFEKGQPSESCKLHGCCNQGSQSPEDSDYTDYWGIDERIDCVAGFQNRASKHLFSVSRTFLLHPGAQELYFKILPLR